MTVERLIEILKTMPQDAQVRIIHELCGDEHWIEEVELKKDGDVWLHEKFKD